MPVFSDQIETWLKGKQPKTLARLIQLSDDKSFAVVILFLMIVPALPLPTAGITHILEVIVILLGLEMAAGRHTVWLPRRWQGLSLAMLAKGKVLPIVLKRVRWLEKRASPRGRFLFTLPLVDRGLGLVFVVLAMMAFISPPFSGLDTLPSLAAVIICLSIILDDALLLLVGLLLGIAGAVVLATLGAAALEGLQHFF